MPCASDSHPPEKSVLAGESRRTEVSSHWRRVCACLTPWDQPRNRGVTTCLPRQETHCPSSNTTNSNFVQFFFIINPKFVLRAPVWWLLVPLDVHIMSHRKRDCRVFFLPILHPFLSAASLQHKFPPHERPNTSPLNTSMSFLFFFYHFSWACMCKFACVWPHMFVNVCTHVCIRLCRMPGITLQCSSTLFSEGRSFSQTQSSLIQLVSLLARSGDLQLLRLQL